MPFGGHIQNLFPFLAALYHTVSAHASLNYTTYLSKIHLSVPQSSSAAAAAAAAVVKIHLFLQGVSMPAGLTAGMLFKEISSYQYSRPQLW